MMYLVDVFHNPNFVDGLPVYIFYNDLDEKRMVGE